MKNPWFRSLTNWMAAAFLAAACAIPVQAQYTDLHDFDTPGLIGPQFPGMLARARDGNLYGTAPIGGNSNRGGIFQVTSAGVYSMVYTFDNTIGINPYSGLTLANDGTLLGANFNNGANLFGTAFQFVPGSAPTTLHNFCPRRGLKPLRTTNSGDRRQLLRSHIHRRARFRRRLYDHARRQFRRALPL